MDNKNLVMEITEIKERLTMSEVLKYYGLKPDKNLRLNCPFHEDKTPSMQVYYKTHTAYCFSSKCKTHGKSLDVIDFIMHKENCTKAEAINKAKQIITGESPKSATQFSRTAFLNTMFIYFKNAVHNSNPVKEYIASRSLNFNKLEIGYNTGQFHHGVRKDETLIKNCLEVGLLSVGGTNSRNPQEPAYKPFAKYSIVFAMRNKANQITGLYFRSSVNNTDAKHFYLKESTGLYPNYPSREARHLIITESIIDAASLLQIESITKNYSILASYGTNRLNDEIKTAIQELTNITEIIFAFDNDEGGRTATNKYAKELKELLPQVKITKLELLEGFKDVNEVLQAHDKEAFIHLLENRKSIDFSFSIENSTEKKEIFSSSNPINPNSDTFNISNPYKLIYQTNTATYTIKGGVDKQLTKLQITLEIENQNASQAINKRRFKTDLYDNKQVEKLLQEASELLQLHYNSLEKDLHKLTDLLDEYRESQTDNQENPFNQENQGSDYILTTQERAEAESFAKDPDLIQSITEKLTQTGIVGEDENKTFLFIIATSHIQENPLNALIQGSSGSGKTNLLKGIYKIMPEESKKIYSRCSEKMLYNVPKYYFKNKLICFEDVDGLGEEAEYAWRELVSNGELISGVSYKDDKGNIGVKELVVYGPITSLACTTKGAIYADNMSRLFLIAIDESKTQTQRINEYQAKEAAGLINKQAQKQTLKLLQNYVRILQPFQVHNPHATKLKLPEGIRDERRLYRLYLYFIDMITVLHQYQRQQKNNKLVATKQDCQLAKDLLFECIMLKMDELDGSLRQFFERLKEYVKKQNTNNYEFTQREIREALKVKKTQLSYYLNELQHLEYVQQTSSHVNKGNKYRILYFDDYQKVRAEVKYYLQEQIDKLEE